MFDAVIFDLDGTLIDTESVAMRTGRGILAEMELEAGDDLFHALIGKDGPSGQLLLRARFPQADVAALVQRWDAAFHAALDGDVPLKPGAKELLERIDLPMALCTSSARESGLRKLEMAGLSQHFVHVITRDDVTAPKPHPEPYLLTAERLGVTPARCLVFEDSETGAQSARMAGCVVVQVPDILPTAGLHADHVAGSLLEGARLAGVI
ncbi:HAD family phosphatase [Gemmobacter lutimaris]|uniref:HAD family phosphatase n=1 Tax=Gemmobacter lutimaris TaxID=2306023 RepID=A0A398BPZ0_9RHOB|nr:HAD family phosphatase [Gemmobacter lutimaris]RID92829.1 HAD family phosphatase [Gemmobacter lutimaris]